MKAITMHVFSHRKLKVIRVGDTFFGFACYTDGDLD